MFDLEHGRGGVCFGGVVRFCGVCGRIVGVSGWVRLSMSRRGGHCNTNVNPHWWHRFLFFMERCWWHCTGVGDT